MPAILHRHQKLLRRAAVQHHRPQPHLPEPSMEPIPNWAKLSRNDEVTVYSGGDKLTTGRIDMLALDGSVFWIIQNGGKGRAMFHHRDGLTVFRHPGKRGETSRRVSYGA